MVTIAKFLALTSSILSLGVLMGHAFFVPGRAWGDRLVDALILLGLSACVCFAAGLIFELPERKFDPEPAPRLTQTLPVQLFFWAAGLMALIFAVSWFLAVDYMPMIWKNQPH
jgi:hypothetical protein